MASAMSLRQRARESGKCPPSLLIDDEQGDTDGFNASVIRLLDEQGTRLLLFSG